MLLPSLLLPFSKRCRHALPVSMRRVSAWTTMWHVAIELSAGMESLGRPSLTL